MGSSDDAEAVSSSLASLGGVASRAVLVQAVGGRRAVDRALRSGEIVALSRGRYALSSQVHEPLAAAHRVCGTLCLTSAALHWGWAVKAVPARPLVSIPRSRNVTAAHRHGIDLRRLKIHTTEMADGVTTRERTVVDCLRLLPADEALAIADSALRDGFDRSLLLAAVDGARGPGVVRMRSLARQATPLAANPFESVGRSIALDVAGLEVRPQVRLRAMRGSRSIYLGRPDLVDDRLKIIIEFDSFEFHGSRGALNRDIRRYNGFSRAGWLVIRFGWEDVMLTPGYVHETLEDVVAERTQLLCPACRSLHLNAA